MSFLGRIRTWALIAVAVTSAALIYFANWLIEQLASPDWCNRALGAAEYASGRPEFAVGGCFQLLNRQIEALALNSHIAFGVLALCLAVLVVIVLAGGKLDLKASRDHLEVNVGRDRAEARGAKKATAAAADVAEQLEEHAAVPEPELPELKEPKP